MLTTFNSTPGSRIGKVGSPQGYLEDVANVPSDRVGWSFVEQMGFQRRKLHPDGHGWCLCATFEFRKKLEEAALEMLRWLEKKLQEVAFHCAANQEMPVVKCSNHEIASETEPLDQLGSDLREWGWPYGVLATNANWKGTSAAWISSTEKNTAGSPFSVNPGGCTARETVGKRFDSATENSSGRKKQTVAEAEREQQQLRMQQQQVHQLMAGSAPELQAGATPQQQQALQVPLLSSLQPHSG